LPDIRRPLQQNFDDSVFEKRVISLSALKIPDFYRSLSL
jgi:predicted protein tyrosine phosphatase